MTIPKDMSACAGTPPSGEEAKTLTQLVDDFAAALSEPDDKARRVLLEGCFGDDGFFVSAPSGLVEGREALDSFLSALQGQMPGARLVRTSGIDELHGCVRFAGKVETADGQVMFDDVETFADLGDGGLLSRVTVFMAPLPPRE